MRDVRYLLVGGGMASGLAAKAIREIDPRSALMLVAQEPHLPYERPPLTKSYMQGKSPITTCYSQPEHFYEEHAIDALLGVRIVAIDGRSKNALLSNGATVRFDQALLATGGRPVRLNLPGDGFENVFYFRTMNDAGEVSSCVEPGKHAVIVGGGFIGLELASSFTQRGAAVTVIDSGPHIWSRFAPEDLARFVQHHCEARGVRFINGDKAAAIEGDSLARRVRTHNGKTLECDFVVIAAGILPNDELARQMGLKVSNGVEVNELLQTNHPDIYAAGDVMNFPDPHFDGKRRRVEHWGMADYSGTLAGQNMAGAGKSFDLLTYVFSDIFDLHIEMSGDEAERDRTLTRGSMDENSFSVLYLKGDRMSAYFSLNAPKEEYKALSKIIERRVNVARLDDHLRNRAHSLESLAEARAM